MADMNADVVARALVAGETTSECAAKDDAVAHGHIWTCIGAVLAGLPQILDMVNALPEPVRQARYPQIILAVIGGLIVIVNTVKGTAAQVAYINGRSLLKAASINAAGNAAAALDTKAAA